MNRAFSRSAAVGLLAAAVLILLFFMLQSLPLARDLIGRPPAAAPQRYSGRPLQALYQLEAQAADEGWTPERQRLAGDLWREAGDLTRAVAHWEAAAPDATLLRDRAQAYAELGRWADAADTLAALLPLLPDESKEKAWAQFQLGLITMASNPAAARTLLEAAQPTYSAQVTVLLPALAEPTDPTRAGIALVSMKLWAYAELAFSQALADPLALAYGGWARDMQGKDGADWIKAAVALAPDSPQVRMLEGLHRRLNADYTGSLAAIIQAAALDPENPAFYAELGVAYQLTGDLASAERWLTFAAGLDANFQPLLDAFYDEETALLAALGLVDEAAIAPDATPSPEP